MKADFNFNAQGQILAPTKEELQAADITNDIICLSCGTQADGKPYYAYVSVMPSLFAEFYETCKRREALNLGDYGWVLMSGNEKEPPQGVKDLMRDEYGFDEDFAENLQRAMLEESKKHQGKMEEKRVLDIVAMLKQAKPAGTA